MERRVGAKPARLFACVLAASAAAALLAAPAAQAAKPVPPRLMATDPVSLPDAPASSTSPKVFGEAEPEDVIIVNAIRSGWARALTRGFAVSHPTKNPEYEIVIFDQPGCDAGSVVGRGRADAFEETGIQVNVAADRETTLSAWQVDPTDPDNHSGCSEPLAYWEGNVPVESDPGGGSGGGAPSGGSSGQGSEGVGQATPAGSAKPPAPRLHMNPSARANDNTPAVAGSAPGAASVLLFTGSGCGGAPVARGSAAQLAAGLEVQVADNTTTTFSAASVAGQRSDCSAPVTYVEDSTPPRTRITMAPGAKTRKRKAVFRFADVTEDPPGTSFRCKLGTARWKPCSSPLRLSHLRLRRYVVRVRATDLAGNVESKGARRSFKVVRRP